MTDKELYERMKQGDQLAFESLFRAYYKTLCFFCYKIVKDYDIAEEIVEDFFYHFWAKHETLELTSSVKSYFFKSVYNNSLKHIKHQKIVQEHENYSYLHNDNVQMPDNLTELGEMTHIIQTTLNNAPERTREIFRLNRYEGLKYHEIANKLDISVKTVEAHMSNLLRTFRQNLKDYLIFLLFFLFP